MIIKFQMKSILLENMNKNKVLLLAKIFGANYEFTHGESFVIWLLMALLISSSVTWKK